MKTTSNDNNAWMMSTKNKLFWAIEHNNFWMTHVLLESGAELNSRNNRGVTPLEYAHERGRKKMWDYLRLKGAR